MFTGHAYTLIGCFEVVTTHSRKKTKLVKIRNPHGNTEWTGDWCDNSDLWTRDIETQVGGLERENDGVFFMSYDDYFAIYSETSICKYHDDYQITSHPIELDNGSILLKFNMHSS